MLISVSQRKHLIKAEARRLGFELVGVAKAEFMDAEARRLEAWLKLGFHGKMSYMENHFDLRTDPTRLVPGAKSVISLACNYFPSEGPLDPEAPKVARYAYGKDYHLVLREKLRALIEFIRTHIGSVDGRGFTDSGPVLERDWAKRSGLGWTGKNTLTLNPKMGSYFFLAELITDLDLEPDAPIRDHCGTCRRCIDACPTGAISPSGYLLDGSKCISYLTIELKEAIPESFRGNMNNWVFGCDICQEVCPWNRFSKPNLEPAFQPHPDFLSMTRRDWQEITQEVFREVFRGSAVKRTKFSGLQRNLRFLKASEDSPETS